MIIFLGFDFFAWVDVPFWLDLLLLWLFVIIPTLTEFWWVLVVKVWDYKCFEDLFLFCSDLLMTSSLGFITDDVDLFWELLLNLMSDLLELIDVIGLCLFGLDRRHWSLGGLYFSI